MRERNPRVPCADEATAIPIDTERRRAVLAAGVRWLYDTEQPDEALDQHHGVYSPEVDGRRYGFCPRGFRGHPVVVVDVAHPRWDWGAEPSLQNPLNEPGEVAAVVADLQDLGYEVTETWNGGEGAKSASLSLARLAHQSLVRAVDRYLAGCPEHRTVFCGHDGCRWYADHNAQVVRPTWPRFEAAATPDPEGAK